MVCSKSERQKAEDIKGAKYKGVVRPFLFFSRVAPCIASGSPNEKIRLKGRLFALYHKARTAKEWFKWKEAEDWNKWNIRWNPLQSLSGFPWKKCGKWSPNWENN